MITLLKEENSRTDDGILKYLCRVPPLLLENRFRSWGLWEGVWFAPLSAVLGSKPHIIGTFEFRGPTVSRVVPWLAQGVVLHTVDLVTRQRVKQCFASPEIGCTALLHQVRPPLLVMVNLEPSTDLPS